MKLPFKLLTPALLLSGTALAQPFAPLDARSMAMGDTGVASAKPGTAAVYNPALLSTGSEADSSMVHVVLPNAGISVFADSDARDAYVDIADEGYLDNITDSIAAMEAATNASDDVAFFAAKNDFVTNARDVNGRLQDLDEQPFRIDIGVFAGIAAPRKNLGMAAYTSSNASIETTPDVSDCDNQLLNDYLTFFESVNSEADLALAASSGLNQAGCNNSPIVNTTAPYDITDPTDELDSSVLVAGVSISEVGVALSKEVQLFGRDVALGITPKFQTITSYYTLTTVQDLDNEDYDLMDDLSDSEERDSTVNLDLGIATTFFGDSLMLGMTVKNLIANSYKTKPTNSGATTEFDVETQVRVGMAWDAPLGLTLAADMDLTKNSAYFMGDDTQFLGAGVEWDVFDVLRLRGGMRTNLANSDDQVLTAGIGLNIIAVYLDLGVQYGDNNAAAALQAGVDF